MAQRLVRAKRKIRDAGIPYEVPRRERAARSACRGAGGALLVFNEGYAATGGDELIRRELCAEAIRLARLLREADARRAGGRRLLALMLLHDARRDARIGRRRRAGAARRPGPLAVGPRPRSTRGWRAASGARSRRRPPGPTGSRRRSRRCTRGAERPRRTDWARIRHSTAGSCWSQPSPVVELNRAVAVAMAGARARARGDRARSTGLDGYYTCTPPAPTCCAPRARDGGGGGLPAARSSSPTARSSARCSSGGSRRPASAILRR